MSFKLNLEFGKTSEERNEIFSNVDGEVVEVTDSSVVIKDEDKLLHTYKNLVRVAVEVGEDVIEGETIGELNTDLYYSVEKETI